MAITPLEIHGLGGCPFAWRARLAAALKGVAFEWLAHDAPTPDERVAAHNPEKRSPLLWEDGFSLLESSVIAAYIDESRDGRSLQPKDAKGKARARVAIVEVGGLMMPPLPEIPPPVKKKVDDTLVALEKRLGDGRAFLDGDHPGLVDVHAWPGLALVVSKLAIPEVHAKTHAYWERSRTHAAYTSTKPSWG